MAQKFVEPINDPMYGWVSPDGSIQMSLVAPDLPMLFGITKLYSKSGMVKSAKQMTNEGFTIHKLKVSIENIEQVRLTGELMADLLNL